MDETADNLYRVKLKAPKYVLAPMVDASELAWRLLARRYGAQLCYTPMLHSAVFLNNEKYRSTNLVTCPEDTPLIAQFCANKPETFCRAVKMALELVPSLAAVDLNLGCPQIIAKRGKFGAFLQDDWDLIEKLIHSVKDIPVGICAKIRVFPSIDKTVQYALRLKAAGVDILTVHGRTRDQKGALTGVASWPHITAVRHAVYPLPVFANGNIRCLADVHSCMDETGAVAVMSAEGHLTNPALFKGLNLPVWEILREYLQIVDKYPCPISYVRGHIFKICHSLFREKENYDLRQIVAKAGSLSDLQAVVAQMHQRWNEAHIKYQENSEYTTAFPFWICQPYVRPTPEQHLEKIASFTERDKIRKNSEDISLLSKKKRKKLERNPNKKFPHVRQNPLLCGSCHNPAGVRCEHQMCRFCCRLRCFSEKQNCIGHKNYVNGLKGTTTSVIL